MVGRAGSLTFFCYIGSFLALNFNPKNTNKFWHTPNNTCPFRPTPIHTKTIHCNLDRSKVENYDLGSLRYVPIDKLAITRRYLRYSITSASAPA